jgi:thioredoxin 2
MQLVCPSCLTTNRVPDERAGDGPVCGRCRADLLPREPTPLDERGFEATVSRSDAPIVVDFWAEWCGPCRTMAPQFAQAARERADLRFVKVDTDRAQALSGRLGIRSVPTIAVFHRGREIARRAGAVASGPLLSWVDDALRAHAGRSAA